MEPLWSPVVSSETSETPKKTRARTHHRRRYRTRKPMQQPTQVKITSSVPVEPGTLLRIPSATRSASRSGTAACASASSLTSPVVNRGRRRDHAGRDSARRADRGEAGVPLVQAHAREGGARDWPAADLALPASWALVVEGHQRRLRSARRCAQRGTRRPPEPDTDRPRASDTRGRDRSPRGCSRRCRVRGGGQPTWSRSSRQRDLRRPNEKSPGREGQKPF